MGVYNRDELVRNVITRGFRVVARASYVTISAMQTHGPTYLLHPGRRGYDGVFVYAGDLHGDG
jgi:hypothetical protein